MTQRRPSLCSGLTLFLLHLLLLGGVALVQPASAQQCEGAKRITAVGGVNRFSDPVDTLSELQQLFRESRDEIAATVAETGWSGNMDDLFDAIAAGSNVTEQSFAPGERFDWMLFRQSGTPVASDEVCWAGREPLEAFEVKFVSGGQWYSMVIPKPCGNLSFLAEHPMPTCNVAVRNPTCEDRTFRVETTGSTGDVQVSVVGPGGQRQTVSGGRYSTDLYKGSFEFTAVCTDRSPRGDSLQVTSNQVVNLDCDEPAPPPPPPTPPTCTIDAPAEVLRKSEFTVMVNPGVGDGAQLTKVTLDGEELARPYSKSFLYKEPGTYTFTAEVSDDQGETTSCSTSTAVVRPESTQDRGFTLIPFVTRLDADSNRIAGDVPPDFRQAIHVGSGSGGGIMGEFRLSPRIGIPLGIALADLDGFAEIDVADAWAMAEPSVDTTILFTGVNFHLTPKSRADLWIGPLIGLVDFDDISYSALGSTASARFDDQTAFGANLGLKYPFREGGNWSLYAGWMWFDVDLEAEESSLGPFDFDLSPNLFNLGVAYDFDW